MFKVEYYVLYPNGREKLRADNDMEAEDAFREHWTRTKDFPVTKRGRNPMRKLVKYIRNELAEEYCVCTGTAR